MAENLVARPRPNQTNTTTRSWFDAYRAFLLNPHENITTKLLPLAVVGIIPLSFLDDLILPFAGVLDDIPTVLLVLFAAFKTWQRVRTYR
jgi:hypothetical protein